MESRAQQASLKLVCGFCWKAGRGYQANLFLFPLPFFEYTENNTNFFFNALFMNVVCSNEDGRKYHGATIASKVRLNVRQYPFLGKSITSSRSVLKNRDANHSFSPLSYLFCNSKKTPEEREVVVACWFHRKVGRPQFIVDISRRHKK